MNLFPEKNDASREDRSACGIAMVVDIGGRHSQEVVRRALTALKRLEYCGGVVGEQEIDGTYSRKGDGAGWTANFTNEFVRSHMDKGKHLPDETIPFAATIFVPRTTPEFSMLRCQRDMTQMLTTFGFDMLGTRHVPTNPAGLGRTAREKAPEVMQMFFAPGMPLTPSLTPRALWEVEQRIRELWEQRDRTTQSTTCDDLPSLVCLGRKLVFKALATSQQALDFFPEDSVNPPAASQSEIHRRMTTNSASSWANVQPFDISENGEDNAIAANRNEVRRLENSGRRSCILSSGASDSRDFSAFIRYLTRARGMSLPAALRATVLPVWWERADFSPDVKDWCARMRHHLGGLSAWGEGPKLCVGGDGTVAAAIDDGMGYRRASCTQTRGGLFVVESVPGSVPIDPEEVEEQFRLHAGDMVVIDTARRCVLRPGVAEQDLVNRERASGSIIARPQFISFGGTEHEHRERPEAASVRTLINARWSKQDLAYADLWLRAEIEPRGAMGRDWAPACLSPNHPHFNERAFPIFASCTNPAIDPESAGGSMHTSVTLGNPRLPMYALASPILTPAQVEYMCQNRIEGVPKVCALGAYIEVMPSILEDVVAGANLIRDRIDAIAAEAVDRVAAQKASIILISDADADGVSRLPIPTAVLCSAVNEALVGRGLTADIVIESSAIRNRHDMMLHAQCGASALCPSALYERGRQLEIPPEKVTERLREAICKAMSLPGVRSYLGYRGAKLVEFVGLGPDLMRHFPGFLSKISGIGMEEVFEDMVWSARAAQKSQTLPAWDEPRRYPAELRKDDGPLQNLARTGDFAYHRDGREIVNRQGPTRLWDLLEILPVGPPIPIDEVATEDEILHDFVEIADISFGALGDLAHRTLARYANKKIKVRGKIVRRMRSGSGEGGERPERNVGGSMEDDMSRCREIASNRYGVDIIYVAGADELRIKIHQGAKPDESADMPAAKNQGLVSIARHAQPGTRLRSRVNNADLHSIEDFPAATTWFSEANPEAAISIKIASNSDNGVIVRGLIKAGPDKIAISGGEGGTGSATQEAIRHTGHPGELGLADAHRAVVADGFEKEIQLMLDGGILFAEDVVKAIMLGARKVAMGTPAMIALGCLLIRACNKADGCKPGVATQNPDLISNFLSLGPRNRGNADLTDDEKIDVGVARLENIFRGGLARAIRELCAQLGVRSPLELWQKTSHLRQIKTGNRRLDKLDLSYLIERPVPAEGPIQRRIERHDTTKINRRMMDEIEAALVRGEKVIHVMGESGPDDLAIGTRLSGDMARNPEKYRDVHITLHFEGSAGFACFGLLHPSITAVFEGFVGENFGASCMDGTVTVARRGKSEPATARVSGRVGNNAFYGSTGGEGYVEGGVGELACVRLSGGTRAIEGDTGKFFCESMSMGTVLHFGGEIGEAPFSGMTGGIAYCLDADLEGKIGHGGVAVTHELTRAQEDEVRGLLEKHLAYTESIEASEILANWETYRHRWSVVTPISAAATSAAGIKHSARSWEVEAVA